MKWYWAFAYAVVAAATGNSAWADEIKDSIITGYRNRCMEVRTKAGGNTAEVAVGCNCEASVLRENFATFELLSVGTRAQTDKRLVTEGEISEFKQKLSACQGRPGGGR